MKRMAQEQNRLRILCEQATERADEALKLWMDSPPGEEDSRTLRVKYEHASGYAQGVLAALKLLGDSC